MRLLPTLLVLAAVGLAHAEPLGNYTSHTVTDSLLVVQAETAALSIRPFAAQMVQVALFPNGIVPFDTSVVVVMRPQDVPWEVDELDSAIIVNLPGLELEIRKFPVRLRFSCSGRPLTEDEDGLFWQGEERGLRLRLGSDERIYGGGERAIPLNRRGQRLNSYNAPQYCYGYGAPDLNITIPFLLSSCGWGIYFDDSFPGRFDVGHSDPDVFECVVDGGQFVYYFIAGDPYADVMEQYTRLVGRQPLPPRWALGYLQSRYGYRNESEARAVVNAFRSQHIPLDAIILDLYWFGWGRMGDFDWDGSAWPNPTTMMRDFDSTGVKTILITEPYLLLSSTNYASAAAAGYLAHDSLGQPVVMNDFWAGPAALIDVTYPAAADWLWGLYANLTRQGVGGWWCDLGEPELHPSQMIHFAGSAARVHNLFSLLWARRIHEGYQTEFPQWRLFNLIRSGYAGMQ